MMEEPNKKCRNRNCPILFELFNNLVKTGKSTERDYYIYTELYVLVHNGKDYCDWEEEN